MGGLTPDTNPSSLAVLVERRSPRGRWVYVTWLILYGVGVMMFAADTGIDGWTRAMHLWPFLIPAVILVAQLVRPTILGWLVICLPTFVYGGTGVYYAVTNPAHDIEEIIGGAVVVALLFGACVALMLAARPK